jgi:hypothetical protein
MKYYDCKGRRVLLKQDIELARAAENRKKRKWRARKKLSKLFDEIRKLKKILAQS